ncbi:MAG: hypothetical protein AAF456_01165 [Planctomycetota bacterium]
MATLWSPHKNVVFPLGLALALLFPGLLRSQSHTSQLKVAEIASQQGFEDYRRGLLEEVRSLEDSELSEVKAADRGLYSLQCAWELFRRTHADGDGSMELMRMIGFIEGRMFCKVPENFGALFVTGYFEDATETFCFSLEPEPHPSFPNVTQAELRRRVFEAQVELDAEKAVMAMSDYFEDAPSGRRPALRDGFVQLTDQQGELVWKSPLWTAGTWESARFPLNCRQVSLSSNYSAEKIFVFCIYSDGALIHEYDAQDGTLMGSFFAQY